MTYLSLRGEGMSGKFEIFLGKNNEFYFRLKAGNGQIILGSEGYTTKANCQNGIASVIKHATDDKRYERKVTGSEKFMFNLKSSNGQIIGTSQLYGTEQARETGINSVKNNAGTAEIVDLTIEK